MNRGLAGVLLIGAGIGAWLMFRSDDPVVTAQVKCEFAIERATGYDISVWEVSKASVDGDVFNGTVRMPFARSGSDRIGECIFRDGRIERVAVDGKVLAGR
jgi:hypothetical protein